MEKTWNPTGTASSEEGKQSYLRSMLICAAVHSLTFRDLSSTRAIDR